MRTLPLFFTVLLLTHVPATLFGQSIAQIRGVAQDSSGGALPGVTVTVTDELTGQQRTTLSDEGGRFNFPRLLVGTPATSAPSSGGTWAR